jgi:hypothetical protein
MSRSLSVFLVMTFVGVVLASEAQSPKRRGAPTFYVAAKAEYETPNEMHVTGASNLPPGAQLYVDINDFIGEGSAILSERAEPTVGNDGFFSATLKPSAGKQFKHNVVCDIGFVPNDPHQPESVLRVVGKRGEGLGFPQNPQAYVNSGERHYLLDLVHVP